MAATKSIALVTRPTRQALLLARHVTPGWAKFHLAQAYLREAVRQRPRRAGATAADAQADVQALAAAEAQAAAEARRYAEEDQAYRAALARLRASLPPEIPIHELDRSQVPTYDFWNTLAVVVVGQDGLVANTAKYVGELPIVGVNPDPTRFDGVLLPYTVERAATAVRAVLEGTARWRAVTLAHVSLNDGQEMLAFNDFYVGAASLVSSRYLLRAGARAEQQSSSGLLVATGAGSTGWLSSVFNMAAGVARYCGQAGPQRPSVRWEDRRLMWVVREPFVSRQSSAELVIGCLEQGDELVVESHMPTGGVIFSDGMEADALEFNAGSIARFSVAAQQARLVVP
jgi:hypothetical protein